MCPNKCPAKKRNKYSFKTIKTKKYQVIRTVQKSNRKIIGSVYIDTLAHIYMHFPGWIQVLQ